MPRHNEQDLAKHLVQFSEDDQLGEVEVGVLSVALPALALGEQLSVGRKLIEVALVREIGCRPSLLLYLSNVTPFASRWAICWAMVSFGLS